MRQFIKKIKNGTGDICRSVWIIWLWEFKLKKFNPTGNVQSKKLQNRILKNSGLDGLLVGHLWLEVVLSQYLWGTGFVSVFFFSFLNLTFEDHLFLYLCVMRPSLGSVNSLLSPPRHLHFWIDSKFESSPFPGQNCVLMPYPSAGFAGQFFL